MSRINRCYTPFVDNVMNFYASGHSIRETATEFNVTKGQVTHWAKVRRVSNGRTFKQGGQESNAKRHLGIIPVGDSTKSSQIRAERAKEHWTSALIDRGFLLLEWKGKASNVTLRCLKCESEFERRADNIRRGVNCPYCRKAELETKAIAKQKEREDRKAEQKAKREDRERKHLEHLNKVCTCKVCGASYTIKECRERLGYRYPRDFGFCSLECKNARQKENDKRTRKKMRENGTRSCVKHYTRAKRLGLPVESGISLKKLIERNGTTCAICGLPCYYFGDSRSDLYPSIDHIIPLGNDPDKKGGHTWANVQVAHRICNSNKRDYVGKEWNNGN